MEESRRQSLKRQLEAVTRENQQLAELLVASEAEAAEQRRRAELAEARLRRRDAQLQRALELRDAGEQLQEPGVALPAAAAPPPSVLPAAADAAGGGTRKRAASNQGGIGCKRGKEEPAGVVQEALAEGETPPEGGAEAAEPHARVLPRYIPYSTFISEGRIAESETPASAFANVFAVKGVAPSIFQHPQDNSADPKIGPDQLSLTPRSPYAWPVEEGAREPSPRPIRKPLRRAVEVVVIDSSSESSQLTSASSQTGSSSSSSSAYFVTETDPSMDSISSFSSLSINSPRAGCQGLEGPVVDSNP